MNLTKEEQEKYKSYNRAYNLYSPNHTDNNAKIIAQQKKEEEAKKKKQQQLLSRLKKMKQSAIKRGMVNQKPYFAKVTEEKNNA